MTALSMVSGIVLILVVMIDLVWTVVAVGEGGGPISSRFSSALWRAVLWAHHKHGSGRWLRFGGVLVVMAMVTMWILAIWIGWWMVFVDGSVVEISTGAASDAWGRLYFAGFTMFTLGVGDAVPATSGWRVVTIFNNLLGLVLVTLAVTYLVPVVEAATSKRALATTISALGRTPQQLVARMWDGHGFTPLAQHAPDLAVKISLLAQQHLAYPVLHYFHSVSEHEALPARIAALDDAFTIMAEGVTPEARLAEGTIAPPRDAIRRLLDTLQSAYITPEVDAPPILDPQPLRRDGIPVVDAETLAQVFRQHAERRRLAAAFVHHDGWGWTDSVVGEGAVLEDFASVS